MQQNANILLFFESMKEKRIVMLALFVEKIMRYFLCLRSCWNYFKIYFTFKPHLDHHDMQQPMEKFWSVLALILKFNVECPNKHIYKINNAISIFLERNHSFGLMTNWNLSCRFLDHANSLILHVTETYGAQNPSSLNIAHFKQFYQKKE